MYMIPNTASFPVSIQVFIAPFVIYHATVTIGNDMMDVKIL